MSYNIIKGMSIDELIANVNIFLTANPLYEAIGNPIFISIYEGWGQAVGEDGI